MTPADSRCLERHVPSKSARADFGLPSATLPHNQSRESGRAQRFKSVTNVIEPESQKQVRFEKPRPDQGAWKQSPPRERRDCALPRPPAKRRKPRHGQIEDAFLETMPVGYELRLYQTEIDVWTVLKRKLRQRAAVRENILESGKSTLVSLFCSASSKKAPGKYLLRGPGRKSFKRDGLGSQRTLLFKKTGSTG